MTSLLIFIAVCGTGVCCAWVFGKVNGARAWFMESWTFDEGETVVWRDDAADVAMVPKLGQAKIMTAARFHRWPVMITNRRVIVANKTITGKRMVRYVLYPKPPTNGQSRRLGGGLLTRGFSTVVIEPRATIPYVDSKYIVLKPDPSQLSSFNLFEVRVYTDDLAGCRAALNHADIKFVQPVAAG